MKLHRRLHEHTFQGARERRCIKVTVTNVFPLQIPTHAAAVDETFLHVIL